MLRIAFVLMLVLACGTAAAVVPETPRLRIIGTAEGLPATDIYGVERDAAGYVWIATNDGLARYDGSQMRVWRHDPADPASLAANLIYMLHIDHRDRIWVSTQGNGLSVLDADRKGFRHFRRQELPEMESEEVYTIASRSDEIWFGSYEGLFLLDAQERITRFAHDPEDPTSLPSSIVLALAFDASGVLWVATMAGLARVEDGRVERIRVPGPDEAPRLFAVTPAEDGVWVGGHNGVHLYTPDGRWHTPSWSPMFERPNHALVILPDRDGGLWLGSARRIWRVSPGSSIPFPVEAGSGLVAPVKAMLLQEDGALWAPVFGEGLGYLRTDWRRIAQFSRSPGGLGGQRYRAVARAGSGGVWLAADDGTIERLGTEGEIERLEDSGAPAGGARVGGIVEAADGTLWLIRRRDLVRIGQDTIDNWNSDSTENAVPQGIPSVLRIAPDGSLWMVVMDFGLQQRDASTGRVLRNLPVGNESDNNWMEVASDGVPWVSGRTGLTRVPLEGAPEPIEATQGSRVSVFAFDGDDALWLHRMTGLERYERSGGQWRRTAEVGIAQGLPAVQMVGMAVDARRRVWMSSTRGLYRWDAEEQQLRHFGVQHGLTSQEFVERALVLSRDGMLVGPTNDGSVVLVDTVADDPAPTTAPLRLDNLSVRRGGQWHPLPAGERFRLAAGDNEFRVDMRLLSFDDPQSNTYWSRLAGRDDDWVLQGASGERVFSNLPAGDYVLYLRAEDAAGNAAEAQRIEFEVLPPWWRTGWALLALIATVLLSLAWWASAYRSRLRRRSAWQLAIHKRELAEQASLAKTRFLATLGHEVRTPMTGVLGMSELLLKTELDGTQRGYTEAIRRAGEHLLRLVNDALDLARIEADRLELDPQPFDLHALLQDVVALTAPLARQRGLDFDHAIADGAPRWLRGDAGRVRQILLNLIGNAIKFTDSGSVGLRVEALSPAGVRLVVSDTGPGFNAEQQQRLFRRFEQAEGARTAARYGGSGLGLAICQELAAAMGGRIDVESAPGEGARFAVELPLPPADPVAAPAVAPAPSAIDLKILLVEDDPTVAEVIAGLLAAQGHAVVHVANGLAALSESVLHGFDMGLLDLDLPGIDGLALARMLREQGFDRPLVAVTARADADVEALVQEAGFDAFLRKPLTGTLLADAIDAAVTGHGKRRH